MDFINIEKQIEDQRIKELTMNDKKRAEFQNMAVSRVKAIAILEFLQDKKIRDGEEWYNLEDEVITIIERE